MKGFIHARAGGAGGGSKPMAPSPPPAVPAPIQDLPPPPSPFETGHVGTPPPMPAGHPVSAGTGIAIVLAMLVITAAILGAGIYFAIRVLKIVGKEAGGKSGGSGGEGKER